MSETSSRTGVNWRQAAGEALLIFLGVGVALGAQAWWEHRSDRELERHLIEGVRSDLARDSSDVATAMQVARARIAGADFLLGELGDADAGRYRIRAWTSSRPGARRTEEEWLKSSVEEYARSGLTAREALFMVGSTTSLQRIDLSDATFREATESGRLNVIQDVELRSRIAEYYFNTSRFGSTTDDRVQVQWEDFRRAMAAAGLSTNGSGTDEQILAALRDYPLALAELKNVRDYAVMQVSAHDVTSASAEAVIQLLDGLD